MLFSVEPLSQRGKDFKAYSCRRLGHQSRAQEERSCDQDSCPIQTSAPGNSCSPHSPNYPPLRQPLRILVPLSSFSFFSSRILSQTDVLKQSNSDQIFNSNPGQPGFKWLHPPWPAIPSLLSVRSALHRVSRMV